MVCHYHTSVCTNFPTFFPPFHQKGNFNRSVSLAQQWPPICTAKLKLYPSRNTACKFFRQVQKKQCCLLVAFPRLSDATKNKIAAVQGTQSEKAYQAVLRTCGLPPHSSTCRGNPSLSRWSSRRILYPAHFLCSHWDLQWREETLNDPCFLHNENPQTTHSSVVLTKISAQWNPTHLVLFVRVHSVAPGDTRSASRVPTVVL